jgi:hypothetical protein
MIREGVIDMDKRKAIIGGGVAILLLVAAAWGFGLFGDADPAVAKLQEIGDQMSDKNLPDAQRDQLRGEFRQQMQSMTDEQRRAFFGANRDQWAARSAERMNEFFAMSKVDQQKRLDEIINQMNRPRDNQRNNGGNANNSNGGRGGRAGMTEAQREERSKRRLDGTTPKVRAQYTEFRRMLDQRAQQRGVKIDNPWGRRGA